MGNVTVCGVEVQPGERRIARIPVVHMARGDQLTIPVHIINGIAPGPVLGVVATLHGDATFGILAIRELLRRVDPAMLAGQVIAMPVANPVAFESFTRTTGVGMNTDKTNLNRVFPGTPQGWLTEQIADAIVQEFVNRVDILVDFHSSGSEGAIDYTRVDLFPGDEAHNARVWEFSKIFGSEILYVREGEGEFPGTLMRLAAERKIPLVLAEMGASSFFWRTEYLEKAVVGLLNLMKHADMLDGEPVLPESQIVLRYGISPRPVLRPRNGGLFLPGLEPAYLGKTVKKGTVLGRVISPYTFETLDEILAPFEETIILMMRDAMSRVNPGDYAYTVGDASRAEYISNVRT